MPRIPLRKYSIGFLVLFLSLPVAASAAGSAGVDLEPYGIILAADAGSEPWLEAEGTMMQAFVASLPEALWPRKLSGAHPLVLKKHAAAGITGDAMDPDYIILRFPAQDTQAPLRQLLRVLLRHYDSVHKVSASNRWREISGWAPAVFGLMTRANNQDPRAYAQTGGAGSPRMDFVTTAEYFFLPPPSTIEDSIKCRLPRKYAFVRNLFASYQSPLESGDVSCKSLAEGLLDDVAFYDPVTGNQVHLGPVTMKTVQGFELLYATPGTGDASEIAGHLLLRIKLDNNPEASARGQENPNDLVISFLANTRSATRVEFENQAKQSRQCRDSWFGVENGAEDFDALGSIVQSLKGLSGGFLTLMDRQTLAHALRNYTIEEDRNLLRYRLQLTREQQGNLLQHLYLAKKNYNAKYYFFDQNCASVLVKIIGQGIGDREIADFDPVVSPPNTLVGLFIRKGLATPVFPSFYSYRKKGFLAQQLLRDRMQNIKLAYGNVVWPHWRQLTHSNESKRLRGVTQLAGIARRHPLLKQTVYELALLLQEAELAFAQKNLNCENYTNRVTRRLRELQLALLRDGPMLPDFSYVKTSQVLASYYEPVERADYERGVPHTRLFGFSLSSGFLQSAGTRTSVLAFSGALEAQDMGSISSIAMQRGGSVKLGAANMLVSTSATGQSSIPQWQLTALEVRKFKEYLNTVPSYFSSQGRVGLGLSLLDFTRDAKLGVTHGAVFGGELLFNLGASRGFSDFAFLGLGVDLHRHLEPGHSDATFVIPVSAETLWSIDQRRNWQWRNRLEYRRSPSGGHQDEFSYRGELAFRYGRVRKALALVKLFASHDEILPDHATQGSRISRALGVGIELNKW